LRLLVCLRLGPLRLGRRLGLRLGLGRRLRLGLSRDIGLRLDRRLRLGLGLGRDVRLRFGERLDDVVDRVDRARWEEGGARRRGRDELEREHRQHTEPEEADGVPPTWREPTAISCSVSKAVRPRHGVEPLPKLAR
jgi:hypothetical protein